MVPVVLKDEGVCAAGMWDRNVIHVPKVIASQDERGIVGTAHACASSCFDPYRWAGDGSALKLFRKRQVFDPVKAHASLKRDEEQSVGTTPVGEPPVMIEAIQRSQSLVDVRIGICLRIAEGSQDELLVSVLRIDIVSQA